MNRYVISVLATQDLVEITDYFAEYDIEAGERFLRKFNHKCSQLVTFPKSGRSYATIRPNLRGMSLDGYIIFYRLLDDGIEVLRVVSGRRDFPAMFEEP
ncbi:type II toxin-antitoxin system RelE/ParE family toxin [cf. Phormidesmis sp. LEGE 11477]|uniref:type II toxin-antitoxin system RelE/ParE family toxin n=1 Tax=cf. Phormidesmis sp. LEGE 11477 TaxID=1828680 RepID=UPI00187EFD4B|nr:type II toxin-antitoxin system RelE/ParE family toxin [cf. Phormidesmis sp. LEGE 11477]